MFYNLLAMYKSINFNSTPKWPSKYKISRKLRQL